jgi:hypothetical protein
MYVNRKTILVEIIPRMGERGGRRMENGEVMNSSLIYLKYCKSFCKCHDIPPSSKQQNIIHLKKHNENMCKLQRRHDLDEASS